MAAARFPGKKAVICMDKSVTYGELEKRSNQLASGLSRLGVRKGDRVGLIFKKSIDSIIALFGILKTGASYVPIDPLSPICRINHIISNCEIKCLIASPEEATKAISNFDGDCPLRTILVSGNSAEEAVENKNAVEIIPWHEVFQTESGSYRDSRITDSYPAYILFTSGSTGSPKGVAISHLNSLTFVNMAADFFEIKSTDRLSGHAPLHFDLSVFDIYVAIKSGATIVLIPEYLSTFPIRLAEYIDEKRISVWNSVPSALTLLAERGKLERFQYDSLRLVLFAGEIFPVKFLRKLNLYMRRAQFFNLYGQTEANSSLYFRIDQIPGDDKWKIPIGKPFPNFEVFALDEKNKIINTQGEEGELYVSASSVAMGYWRDKEKTGMSFIIDPLQHSSSNRVYRTGDIVRLDNDGNYVFMGRKDNLIKSRGYRIELDEIELSLYSYPGIKQVAIVTIPDDLIGNRIIGYVAGSEGKKIEVKEILKHCNKKLLAYMMPETIVIRDHLPTTSTGKIDKKLLAKEALSKFTQYNVNSKTIF
jgi:amino acid adenylation domain-containing protein